jgi:outer membrane immunogenic protein
MKKALLMTVAALAMVSESRIAVADSTDDAIRRLEARIDIMAKENAALRARLNRIEGTRATSTAHVAATSAAAMSAKQEPSNAMAASLPVKAVPAVAPPPPLWNWTGFYLGGNLGVGISRNQFSQGACNAPDSDLMHLCNEGYNPSNFGASTYLGSHNGLGVVGGVQLGYNWQFANSPVVVGIEGTYRWADIKGDHQNGFNTFNVIGFERFATETKGIATIVGKLGIASGPQDRTLWYVTGGGAWRNTEIASVATFKTQRSGDPDAFSDGAYSGTAKKWGWTVGTGVEFGLFDNWSTKIQYDYLNFGNKSIAFNGTGCQQIARTIDLKQQIHMVTVGLNYRFNWWR